MQMETMMKYQLISVRMVIIQGQEITSVNEDMEKGNPCTPLVGMYIDAATVGNGMEFPQKSFRKHPVLIAL